MDTTKSSHKLRNRLFIGGLQARVDEMTLLQYFSQFGEIIKAQVMRCPRRNISKGYGFITCKKVSTAKKIINYPNHMLLGRGIDVGKAAAKWETEEVKKLTRAKKIFITGIGLEITEGKICSL